LLALFLAFSETLAKSAQTSVTPSRRPTSGRSFKRRLSAWPQCAPPPRHANL